MLKKSLSVLIAFIILISAVAILPASVSAEKTDAAESGATELPNSLFLQQSYSGMCTLSSTAMMLRARMYLSGNSDWPYITESTIRSVAWMEGVGLRFNFTYTQDNNSISVSHENLSGISVSALKSLLNSHPEGIVLLCYDVPHAVLVTDYDGNTFYCADPAPTYAGKRRTLASSYTGEMLGSQSAVLNAADAYWYVSSYSITGNINLGNEFYAMIANSSNTKAVGIDPEWNVTVRSYEGNNDQLWRFVRQPDGGYWVINVYTDIFLIGDNIASLEPQAGKNNKLWYIRKVGSGYGLAHYSGGVVKYLRPYSGSWSNGTILTLTTTPSNVNINLLSGSSNKPKNFTAITQEKYTHDDCFALEWNKSKFANYYTVNLWKDNGEHLITTTTRNNFFDLYGLDTGYYGAYIKACNSLGSSDNTVIRFHVTKDMGDKDFCAVIGDENQTVIAHDTGMAILNTYGGYNHQAWEFLFQDDGSYLIRNLNSQSYLAAVADSVFVTDEITENAKWFIGGFYESDYCYLYNVSTGSTLRLTPTDSLWEDGQSLSAAAEEWEFYLITPLDSDSAVLLGDADTDGLVTVMDATAIQKRLAKIPILLSFDESAADINADGLDITDANNIQKFVSRIPVPYAIGRPIGGEPETEPQTQPETQPQTESETEPQETESPAETQSEETDPPEPGTQEPETVETVTQESETQDPETPKNGINRFLSFFGLF